ncbi:DMT family transporter [Halarcobacter ebronensis]|uniref:EamA family transporter n=1 Tax=Halarcobacter ebronensis TaxID=1462615 RepID=A0A4Q1AL76_9BACT|nr:EamA family transporter [Halarcobacter ebronensis]QKF81618.1 EamA/RhaT family transporter [Halarcobacter ebronensis]RXK05544.1 EamA family transporter [Halarcobacter ebronensis]
MDNTHAKGNILGLLTILLWSSLALFTVLSGSIPPFQLLAISFFIASFIGLFMLKKQKRSFKELFKIPFKIYLVGLYGLFGYHFFYFVAIKNAPAIEANLLNYLWPLLIVVFSALLPNEKLKWYHIVGTFLALVGAFLLVSKGGKFEFDEQYFYGFACALAAAIIWSSYSVISKTLKHIPTFAVTGFCLLTALFSLIAHLILEQTIIPSATQLFASIMLGLGPVGGAFYLWDFAVKNGDIKILGSLSYLAPLLSTLILVFMGIAPLTSSVIFACILIVLGSIISSKEYIKVIKKFFIKS